MEVFFLTLNFAYTVNGVRGVSMCTVIKLQQTTVAFCHVYLPSNSTTSVRFGMIWTRSIFTGVSGADCMVVTLIESLPF